MSVQVWEGDGLTARSADAAVQRVFHDDGVDDLICARAKEADDVRAKLGVFAAGPAPAEPAGAQSGLFTGPAVHAAHLCRRSWGRAEGYIGRGARGEGYAWERLARTSSWVR